MSPQTDTLLTFARFLYSGLPLFVLAAAILRFRLPLFTAGLLSCLTALLFGFSFLGANPLLLLYALGKGAAFTAFIATFLITAIIFFHVVTELGVIDAMGKRLFFLSYRPLLQVLVLAWCFAGFMEGIVGFAIPVILVSPLLIAGGVPPFKAVALTLIGHAWAVTYGTVGVALVTLSLSSRIPLTDLTFWVALQIGLAFILTGFAVAHIYGGWSAVWEGTAHILVAGAGTIAVFFTLTFAGIPQLSAIIGGIAGAVLLIVVDSILSKRVLSLSNSGAESFTVPTSYTFAPYLILCTAVLIVQSAPLRHALSSVGVIFSFPSVVTALGYVVPAEPNFVQISLRHPGFAILFASLISFLLMRFGGYYKQSFPRSVLLAVFHRSTSTTVTLFVLVATAMVMNDTGMTTILAMGASGFTGSLYPLLAPYVGVLGTFLTGSNTNSNLLFGLFQHSAAISLGITPGVLAASHTAAAAVASSIAPAKILISTTAIGIPGKERSLLSLTLPYCMLIVLAIGTVTLFLK